MKAEYKEKEIEIKDYRRKLGNTIRVVREMRGYSQEQLAEMINVNCSTLEKIEKGRFSISVDYLVKFSISLDYEFKVIEK
ncbi:MAG: helix-turn-helix domain-containing protein [Ignavibacteriales bacterium]|nr:helix-turn-helix domain-containing protein [Ignavibacteriales bacterium]MCF8307033.1 helix-turn-helix domain-containing protein [Ignavibacteriales bacterium]MCF8316656.1 helix-turn-helix domain-containing protein [Ignavibacteriales bacterium]MCF8438312.1 helix-turn-helix domain-containing protein [Ignavibacteriales bacterium]